MNFKTRFKKILARIPIRRFQDPDPMVSVLRLNGIIGRAGPFGNGMTLASLEKNLEKAFSGSRVKTVALVINSPGGSPVQSAMISRRIRELSDEKDIPVIAFTEDVAASGGYWLACSADEIYADENSLIGSIGVISSGFGFNRAIERLGIERRVHTVGKKKGMMDPFQPENQEDIETLKEIQKEIHESFKKRVTESRGEKLSKTKTPLFDGEIWTGRKAETLGLVDGIGDMRSVMRKLHGDRVKYKFISFRSNPIKRIFGGSNESKERMKVISTLSVLEEWAVWKRFGL